MRTGLITAMLALAALTGTARAQDTSLIKLSTQQVERLGIRVERVEKADYVALLDLVGRVTRAPDGVGSVVAPFAGAITKIHALPGSNVRVGDPIASIASRDFAATSSMLRQAEAEASAATSALARHKQLVDMGLAPKSSLEEAELRLTRANALVQEARSTAAAAGPSGQAGVYIVRAPATGRLSKLNVRVGDSVDAMSPLASLSTSKSLWIEFQIPLRVIGQVSAGDTVVLPGETTTTMLSVTDVIDPATRSATAIAAMPDGFAAFEGQLIQAKLNQASSGATLLQAPTRAIVQLNGVDHVFRLTPDGFSATPVQVVGKTAEAATLSGGLRPGDAVATSGLSELKALALQGAQ